jgi:hypothetical protein
MEVAFIDAPLGSSFALPSHDALEAIRIKWTTESRYLVRGQPLFWSWFASYVSRLRDADARISIKQDTSTWLGGSKDILFTLLKEVGYRGLQVFQRKTRLFSEADATQLYDLLVVESAERTAEELLEAGVKVGAYAATKQIERGAQQDVEVIVHELTTTKELLVNLQTREQAWITRETGLVDENTLLKSALDQCRVDTARHVQELEAYTRDELDANHPPPPPPYDVPSDFLVDVPPPPPPLPLRNTELVGAIESTQAVLDRVQRTPTKALNNGRAVALSLQEQIKSGTTLKSVAIDTEAPGRIEEKAEHSLALTLQHALANRRGAVNHDEENSDDDDDDGDWDYYSGITRLLPLTCHVCGVTAVLECVCKQARYCSYECQAIDDVAHTRTCNAVQ